MAEGEKDLISRSEQASHPADLPSIEVRVDCRVGVFVFEAETKDSAGREELLLLEKTQKLFMERGKAVLGRDFFDIVVELGEGDNWIFAAGSGHS